ncbi:MAG: hypothetical protein GAK28_00598 [Luteibacter sp.]|uniref:hypothetical protein n=1 Tax=Luteibacter sp. TaxID=1886636 RepID=UPI00137CF3E4|nr:hypothetical protein [Luteibacter sp.]KAF1008966.1 MAG: hypothetical protein GAK28_00598 [Luteibacter sp.]
MAKQDDDLKLQRLRARLKTAIAEAPTRLTQRYIAEQTGVSDQAVGGWLRTGRIDKKHFRTLARLTGKPLSYFHGEDLASPADVVEGEVPSDEMRPSTDTLRAALVVTERVLDRTKVAVPAEQRAELVLAVYDLILEGQGVSQAERTVSRMLRVLGGATVTD